MNNRPQDTSKDGGSPSTYIPLHYPVESKDNLSWDRENLITAADKGGTSSRGPANRSDVENRQYGGLTDDYYTQDDNSFPPDYSATPISSSYTAQAPSFQPPPTQWSDASSLQPPAIYSNEGSPYKTIAPALDKARPTITALGWGEDDYLLEHYHFVVPTGKEPYFALNSSYAPTPAIPAKIFLYPDTRRKKGEHFCLHPAACNSKSTSFRRADLERHYQQVHVSKEHKASFPCDYKRCDRQQDPFTRRDHLRDHLRVYHMEDIRKFRKSKNEFGKENDEWWKERNVDKRWWRCEKCLVKIVVKEAGWICGGCGGFCDGERRSLRESVDTSVDKGKGIYCENCDGHGGVQDEYGVWAPCQYCQGVAVETDMVADNAWTSGTF